MGTAEFVKAFKVASSFDGKTYTVYRADGQRKDKVRNANVINTTQAFLMCLKLFIPLTLFFFFFFKVFVGNTDNDGTKTNMFDPPIVAQYIRIIPVVCRKACTLRMELVGCELNGKFS